MKGLAGTIGIKPLTMQTRNQEESKFIPGGVEAFSKVVDAYQHRVHGFVRRMVPSSEDAEDITQEVFIRAFQNYERFDARASVRTWLFRIAYNLCVDRARKAGRTVQQVSMNMSAEIEEEYEVADARWQPDTILEDTEMYARVEQAIGRMSDKLRSVLLLHDKEDLSYEEISESLGIPVGTVKSRLFLARNQLQQSVRDLVEEKSMKTRFEREPVVTDEMLASQVHVKDLVAGLKDDSLSMAWRSELNLKLLAAADKKKKAVRFRRFATWGSSLGLAAVAGSFAMLMFQPVAPVRGSGSEGNGIAREFVQVHNESSVLASVSGPGVNQRETELGIELGYSYEDML